MAKTYTIVVPDADDTKLRLVYSDPETELKRWFCKIIDAQKSAEAMATVVATDPTGISVSCI